MNRKSAFFFLSILPLLGLAAFASETPVAPGGLSAGPAAPILTVRKNQRMLVVTMQGDPSMVGDKAMKILYGAFFRNATEAEKNSPIVPRARWALSPLHARKRDWIGTYALPISADFPDPKEARVRIEDWRYGLVAEILHIGPYEKEAASIGILKDFIAANGFTISGDFEEEYLLGRGTFSEDRPEAYRTILRFQVDNIQDFPDTYVPLSALP